MYKIIYILLIYLIWPFNHVTAQWKKTHTFSGNRLCDLELDVNFSDTHYGWILSEKKNIFITADKGKTWNSYSTGVSTVPKALKFKDDKIGLMVGSSKSAWYTDSGGEIWNSTLAAPPAGATLASIEYLKDAGFHVWAVGSQEAVIYSNNSGDMWTVQHSGNNFLTAVDFINRDTGWAVGTNNTIIHTTNGSSNNAVWNPQSCPVNYNLNELL